MIAGSFERTTWGTPLPIKASLMNDDRASAFVSSYKKSLNLTTRYTEEEINGESLDQQYVDDATRGYPYALRPLSPSYDDFEMVFDLYGVPQDVRDEFSVSRTGLSILKNGSKGGDAEGALMLLRTFLTYGDDIYNFGQGGALLWRSSNEVWQLAGDEIGPLHLAASINAGFWDTILDNNHAIDFKQENKTRINFLKMFTRRELAFVVARYPRALVDTLKGIATTPMVDKDVSFVRKFAGAETLAWFIGREMLFPSLYKFPPFTDDWEEKSGMSFGNWIRQMYDVYNLSFDKAWHFVENGLFSPVVIAHAIHEDIDPGVGIALLRGE